MQFLTWVEENNCNKYHTMCNSELKSENKDRHIVCRPIVPKYWKEKPSFILSWVLDLSSNFSCFVIIWNLDQMMQCFVYSHIVLPLISRLTPLITISWADTGCIEGRLNIATWIYNTPHNMAINFYFQAFCEITTFCIHWENLLNPATKHFSSRVDGWPLSQ